MKNQDKAPTCGHGKPPVCPGPEVCYGAATIQEPDDTMGNEAYSILDYHRETSHERGSTTGRALNRADAPVPFKMYRNVPIFHLGHDLSLPEVALDKALRKRPLPDKPNMPQILAAVCNLTAGITQTRKSGENTLMHLRASASAGALYPAELYVAIQNVNGTNDGLYHYSPLQHTLSMLRPGYVFGPLSSGNPMIRFYLTSIYHRSSWKYGPRAYRYCLLDVGHMVENLRLAAHIHGLPAQIDYDFNDREAGEFLGIDREFEGCLVQVHSVGCRRETDVDATVPLVNRHIPGFSKVAPKAAAPEALLKAHQATSSFARCPVKPGGQLPGEPHPVQPPHVPASTASTLMTRRSRRNFIPTDAAHRDLADVIGMVCNDVLPGCSQAISCGFLASPHSGLTPGYHRINRTDCTTTLIKPGNHMAIAARVCLDQGWLENAALHFVFTANLEALNQLCGPRIYRYAHLEAGRIGQRIYLAATGKQLGACGIGAFFDKEAVQLLSLPPGEALLYMIAVGPVRR